MDGNQIENNIIETINCSQCGASNNKTNHFCQYCGASLNENTTINQNIMQTNQNSNVTQQPVQPNNNVQTNQNVKEKNPYLALMIILGIASTVLTVFYEKTIILVVIATIASLFNKTTRPYGLTVLITYFIGLIIGVIFFIIFIGMCFAALGG